MAYLYAVKSDLRFVDKEKVHAKWGEGKVRSVSDYYDLSGAITDGDYIRFGKVPAGALLLGASLDFTDLDGSGGTIDLGWRAVDTDNSANDDPDGLLAAVDVTSAGSVHEAEQTNLVGRLTEIVYESWIEAKINLCDATTGKIKVTVFYAVD